VALPILVRQTVDRKLAAFYERRLPAELHDEIRLLHTVRGNSVTLIEARPPFRGPAEWSQLRVAQFRYDAGSGTWTLHYADRNGRWHQYWDMEPSKKLDDLIREVDQDPTGIFWG
jgi:Txe/YoeB family toxin of Txe-Axe toxin-antitoxin module